MIQHVTQIEKEFLLKTTLERQHPYRFHGRSTAISGFITRLDRHEMVVSVTETGEIHHFALFEHITGYFDIHGTTYAFDSIIRSITNKELVLDNPQKLLKSLQRTFVRIRKPQDVHVHIKLANEDIQLDYPVCNEYASVDPGETDRPILGKTLQETILKFKQSIQDKVSNETIIMFRTRKPENFEEILITKTGKILYIPSTTASLPKTDPYPEGRLITEKIEEDYEDPDYFITGSRFERLLKQKKDKGITSEIWCPVVYYQYVVGYVYVANSGQNAMSFDIEMVDFLWEFTRVLAWQLKNFGYFDSDAITRETPQHKAEIIDMSPGGMLIALPKNEIRVPIKEGSVFSVQISLRKQTVSCVAKVTRRFDNKETVSYGTTFLNLGPQDMILLYEFLYRKEFCTDDPLAYEQQRLTKQ